MPHFMDLNNLTKSPMYRSLVDRWHSPLADMWTVTPLCTIHVEFNAHPYEENLYMDLYDELCCRLRTTGYSRLVSDQTKRLEPPAAFRDYALRHMAPRCIEAGMRSIAVVEAMDAATADAVRAQASVYNEMEGVAMKLFDNVRDAENWLLIQ